MSGTAATTTLVIERDMPHPPQKVWRALTQQPLIEEWLMKNDFAPNVGHKFKFRSQPVQGWDGVIDAEVLTLEPHTRIVYSWATMGATSMVTWTLTPTKAGTHLRMEQTGFASEEDRAYKGAKYGWTSFIGKMEEVVAKLD
ncbi:MAG: SRPBCC domain-containing protein [Candidatus Acidiferrales bacterium]